MSRRVTEESRLEVIFRLLSLIISVILYRGVNGKKVIWGVEGRLFS